MTCPKCGAKMADAGMMNSGNSKFKVMKCENCGHEKMECLGLVSRQNQAV
jgi:transposase